MLCLSRKPTLVIALLASKAYHTYSRVGEFAFTTFDFTLQNLYRAFLSSDFKDSQNVVEYATSTPKCQSSEFKTPLYPPRTRQISDHITFLACCWADK